MKGVHGPGPYFDGPGPQRGSMDQGPMFCTFPKKHRLDKEINLFLTDLVTCMVSILLGIFANLMYILIGIKIYFSFHKLNGGPVFR